MDMDSVYMRIRDLREKSGYTQEYVGEKLGISPQAYLGYEKNRMELSVRQVIGLAELYHVSTDYILGKGMGIDSLTPDSEFIGDISYEKLLNALMRLDEEERKQLFKFLTFLHDSQG